MKKIKILLLIIITGILTMFLLSYACFLFLVPKIVKSDKAISEIKNFLKNKTQLELDLAGLEFNPNYNLSFNIKAHHITMGNALKADNLILDFAPLRLMPQYIAIKEIYFDKTKLPIKEKSKKKTRLKLKTIPDLKINKANVIIQNDEYNYFAVELNNINIKNSEIKAKADLERNVLKSPKNKKFIDNFTDLKAKADIDLKYSNEVFFGNVLINEMSAKNVQFLIPLYFKDVSCNFNKNTITLNTTGLIGKEKAHADLLIADLFNDRKVKGSVKTTITNELTKTYMPDFKLDGNIIADIDYFIHNKKPVVEYKLSLPKGTRLGYKTIDLGLVDNNKRIYAKTLKDGNNLFIQNYDYSFVEGKNISNIITGNALFTKQNGKMALDYVTCKAKGAAPASIIGTFNRFIKGGTFEGELKYSGIKKILTGDFRLINSRYKNFIVDIAQIKANNSKMVITAKGIFENEPYSCLLDLENKNSPDVVINDIKLYLRKYIIRRPEKTAKAKRKLQISEKVKDSFEEIDLTVKNGSIKLDELSYKDIVLNNIELIGNSKDNIVNFTMPGTKFAKGILTADGKYDVNAHSSDVNFSAEKIDSNIAANMLFGLENQIAGYANASMRVLTFNKLESIIAYANFAIEDGALTKIGSTDFMMKNRKFKIQDLTNFDIKKMEALRSTIIGSFDVNEHRIENAEIFAKHKYLSLYIKGNYDTREKDANLNIFGAYNKDAQKGIKVLFVPLSIITKVALRPEKSMEKYQDEINKIPVIYADNKQKQIFTVRLKGDLNDNKEHKKEINIQLKRLTK